MSWAERHLIDNNRRALVDNPETTDFTVVYGDLIMELHSYVLAIGSPFFKTALASPMVEKVKRKIEIKDCSPEVLVQAVAFMYGTDVSSDFTDLPGLLEIAERFQIEKLKEAVGDLTAKTIDKNNFIEICRRAEKFNAKLLVDKCAKFGIKNNIEIGWEVAKDLPNITFAKGRLLTEANLRMKSELESSSTSLGGSGS